MDAEGEACGCLLALVMCLRSLTLLNIFQAPSMGSWSRPMVQRRPEQQRIRHSLMPSGRGPSWLGGDSRPSSAIVEKCWRRALRRRLLSAVSQQDCPSHNRHSATSSGLESRMTRWQGLERAARAMNVEAEFTSRGLRAVECCSNRKKARSLSTQFGVVIMGL